MLLAGLVAAAPALADNAPPTKTYPANTVAQVNSMNGGSDIEFAFPADKKLVGREPVANVNAPMIKGRRALYPGALPNDPPAWNLRGAPPDACCDVNAVCTLVPAGTCTGTVIPGNVCAPNPCPATWCDGNGNCTLTTASTPPAGSLYGLAGTTCTPNPCANSLACCAPDGTCAVVANYNIDCIWLGFGVVFDGTCSVNPCVAPACAGIAAANCQQTGAPLALTGGLPLGLTGASSDAVLVGLLPFNVADNFVAGVTGPVTQICWYGYFGAGGSFASVPAAAAMTFRIRYYNEVGGVSGGRPGTLISEFNVGGATPTVGTTFAAPDVAQDSTTYLYSNFLAFGFEANHPAVNLTAGQCYWVEIVHTTPGILAANRFRWISADAATDSYWIQKAGAVDPITNPFGFADILVSKDRSFCLGSALGNVLTGCPRLAPPANANCATATTITPGFIATNAQTISGGTLAAPFCGANLVSSPQVWYRVVGNGFTMTASTCGPNTAFDTIINIYCSTVVGTTAQQCGTGNTALFCVADNDTGPVSCVGATDSDPSQVSWPTTAGRTYFILVSGFQVDSGFFDFSLTSDAVAVNAPDCVSDRCPPQNNVGLNLEVDACGVDTEIECQNTFALGQTSAGTMYNLGLLRDVDDWALVPALPANTWVTVTIEAEFPMLHQGATGICPAGTFGVLTLDDGTGYGEIVSYKPCGPKTFTALTADGVVNIVVTTTDFGGLPCTDGNNDYRFTVTLAPTGACCILNTACFVTAPSACAIQLGVYSGDNSVCGPSPCAGACCAADGSCTFVSAAVCTTGNFSEAVACSPNPCPAPVTGSCCCGSNCSITTAAACPTGPGTNSAFNLGGVCTPFSLTVPCCRGDYNKSGGAPSVQDIFDFLSGYFSASPCANTNDVGGVSVQDIFDFLSAYFGGC